MDGSPSTGDEFQGRAAALLEPIPGPEPAGQSSNFDPRYEAVRVEIGKLDAPTGGDIDWKQIARGCRELLTGSTKDFLLASYHAYALTQLERWAGLAVGLAVIDGLIDRFWDKGFPPAERPRGRGNALDWLVARLEVLVPELRPGTDEVVAFESVRSRWSALAASMRDRLGEHCPGMGGVGDALERHRLSVPTAAAPIPPTQASAPTPVAPAAAVPDPTPVAAPTPGAATSESPPSDAAADPLAEITAAAAKWLQPIPGATPAGGDARFEPAHEAARTEVGKLEAVSSTPPDWKIVFEHASSILATKSKDLLMASYLAYAGLKRGGLRELCIGMVVVTGVMDGFWDDLQPTRLRGRSNALTWFIEQTELALAELPLDPKMRKDVIALEAAVSRFVTVTRDRMAAEAPGTSGLGDRVKRMLLAVPEAKPEPAPTPTTSAPATTTPTSTPAPVAVPSAAAPSNADGVTTFLQETGRALVSAAHLARAAAPASATGYRLLRVGLYLHLQQAPPADAGGKTQVPALPAARRTQFALMEQNAKWDALIDESESALGQFRFALDLQRITWRALERLGESHAAARTAIVAELGALLRRMPTLPDLIAVDGTALADAETKAWIAEVVLAGTGAAASSGASAKDDEAVAFAEIRGMMNGGKAGEAMKLATARIDAATNAHQRFARRLLLAQLCLDGGQAVLARGLFAALDRELRDRGLDEWEPALAARVLEGFVRSIRVAAKAGARYEGADLVYERLCLLDPAAAARLSSS